MKAYIEVEKLRIRACHGLTHQERTVGNIFEISLKLEYPLALNATKNDLIPFTINYGRLVEIVKSVMCRPSNLLEHVAGQIYNEIITEYPQVSSGTISVAKIAPPIAAELSSAKFILEF